MRTCRAVEILSRILPIRAWKGDVLQHHIDRCSACRRTWPGAKKPGTMCSSPTKPAPSDSIWPAVEARIRTKPQAPRRRANLIGKLWKPITGITAVAGVLLLIFIDRDRPGRPAPPSRCSYRGLPARFGRSLGQAGPGAHLSSQRFPDHDHLGEIRSQKEDGHE